MTRVSPERIFLFAGSISAFVAVAAGAFAAHALKSILAPGALAVFETAARYQMYHALGLLAVAWVCSRFAHRLARVAGWCFVTGTVLFCGSLYALALSGVGMLGAITPVGGIVWLAGWICLAWLAWRAPTANAG